jgi:hypothetical protein
MESIEYTVSYGVWVRMHHLIDLNSVDWRFVACDVCGGCGGRELMKRPSRVLDEREWTDPPLLRSQIKESAGLRGSVMCG